MARLHDATTAAEVEAALAAGQDVDQPFGVVGWTPLVCAVCHNRVEVVRSLIAAGANVNIVRHGNAPLHFAALYNRREIAGILIASGADVNGRDRLGRTPIFYACNTVVLSMLMAACADIETRDWHGQTPFGHSVKWRRWGCALMLVQHGADASDPWLLFRVVLWIT